MVEMPIECQALPEEQQEALQRFYQEKLSCISWSSGVGDRKKASFSLRKYLKRLQYFGVSKSDKIHWIEDFDEANALSESIRSTRALDESRDLALKSIMSAAEMSGRLEAVKVIREDIGRQILEQESSFNSLFDCKSAAEDASLMIAWLIVEDLQLEPSPFEPLFEIWEQGFWPIGSSDGKFFICAAEQKVVPAEKNVMDALELNLDQKLEDLVSLPDDLVSLSGPESLLSIPGLPEHFQNKALYSMDPGATMQLYASKSKVSIVEADLETSASSEKEKAKKNGEANTSGETASVEVQASVSQEKEERETSSLKPLGKNEKKDEKADENASLPSESPSAEKRELSDPSALIVDSSLVSPVDLKLDLSIAKGPSEPISTQKMAGIVLIQPPNAMMTQKMAGIPLLQPPKEMLTQKIPGIALIQPPNAMLTQKIPGIALIQPPNAMMTQRMQPPKATLPLEQKVEADGKAVLSQALSIEGISKNAEVMPVQEVAPATLVRSNAEALAMPMQQLLTMESLPQADTDIPDSGDSLAQVDSVQAQVQMQAEAQVQMQAQVSFAQEAPPALGTVGSGAYPDVQQRIQEPALSVEDLDPLASFNDSVQLSQAGGTGKKWFFVLFFLAGLGGAGWWLWSHSAASELLKIEPLLQQGQFAEAEEKIRALLSSNANYAPGYKALGHSLWGQKKESKAIVAYKKSYSLDPEDSLTARELGILLKRKGYYKESLKYLKRASENKKADPLLLKHLGVVQAELQLPSASESLRSAMRLFSEQKSSKKRDSMLASTSNDLGVLFYRKALQIDQESSPSQMPNPQVLTWLEQAESFLREAMKQRRYDPLYLKNQADILSAQASILDLSKAQRAKKYTEAKRLYRLAMQMGNSTPELYTNLATLHLRNSEFSSALPLLKKSLSSLAEKQKSGSAEAKTAYHITLFNFAFTLEKVNLKARATSVLLQYVQRVPSEALGHLRLAKLLLQLKKRKEAGKAFFRAGKIYSEQAKRKKAIFCFRQVVRLKPSSQLVAIAKRAL